MKDFVIPPQPKIVTEICELLKKPSTGVNQIANLAVKEASLTAQLLKTVNTPYFSRGRKIESVSQAITIMGLSNFSTIVLKSALRQVYKLKDKMFFESFWRHSELAAMSCDLIAKKLDLEVVNDAYIAGLFHDCAIPIMTEKYSDYTSLLKNSLSSEENAVLAEDNNYSTNHCTLGYYFTKAWKLPEEVCQAIRFHHETQVDSLPNDGRVQSLVALLTISEYIVQCCDMLGTERTLSPEGWMEKYPIIDFMGISANDVRDFEQDLIDKAY